MYVRCWLRLLASDD